MNVGEVKFRGPENHKQERGKNSNMSIRDITNR